MGVRRLPVQVTIPAGRKGSKRLFSEYGEQLICVRFRIDSARGKRYKTVELIIEERNWEKRGQSHLAGETVNIRVAYHEREMREAVKAAGGIWDRDRRMWRIRWKEVERLGLAGRVVD